MEDALVLMAQIKNILSEVKVLILVLMEDALVPFFKDRRAKTRKS